MGLEAAAVAIEKENQIPGKLHVDSKQIEFRSKSLRWSIPLDHETAASAEGPRLVVRRRRKKFVVEVGKEIDKWVSKVNNPPSRMKKLGVKPGHVCWLSKGFGKAFADELRLQGAKVTRKLATAEILFLKTETLPELKCLPELIADIEGGTHLWIVWPKGIDSIRQSDVLSAAKELGMGPSKTAAFDDGLSSMRFTFKG